MYVRIVNNTPIFPYTVMQLLNDESRTSFPDVISNELLASFNVFPVVIDSRPDTTYQQDAISQAPVFEDGRWVQHWSVVSVSEEVAQMNLERKTNDVRDERNRYLQETDWTQGKDIPDSISDFWKQYRQDLRDLTDQSGFPFNVIWPTRPG
jgi:hypothetical protein